MDKEHLIKLTSNLYQLTILFPKKEPLRYKMREVADEILAGSILYPNENPKNPTIVRNSEKSTIVGISEKSTIVGISENLEVLDSFFEVAKNQNWVSPWEILNLQQEYSKLKEDLKKLFATKTQKDEKEPKITQVTPAQITSRNFGRNSDASLRQKKILEILRKKEKAQVWELEKIFPGVTKRTVRRDCQQLLKEGKVERMGESNDTYYQFAGRT